MLYLDLCDLLYRCGCRAWWAGAAEHCNIQVAGPPDCPWCSYGFWGGAIPFLGIVAAQAAVVLVPGRSGALARFLWALVAFVGGGAVFAVAFGLAAGYWAHG